MVFLKRFLPLCHKSTKKLENYPLDAFLKKGASKFIRAIAKTYSKRELLARSQSHGLIIFEITFG
jgi:hypothetical protein